MFLQSVVKKDFGDMQLKDSLSRFWLKRYCSILLSLNLHALLISSHCTAQKMDNVQVFNACVDAVVKIETPGGSGSGFIVNSSGWIVTNHHVVQNTIGGTYFPYQVTVRLRDGSVYTAQSVDDTPDFPGLDLAILKITSGSYKTLPILGVGNALQAEEVLAIGHPKGLDWTTTKGVVSKIDYEDYIQMDVPINPGNSGGPLINARGLVVGVNTLKRVDMQNTNFALKCSRVREVLNARNIEYETKALVVVPLSSLEELEIERAKLHDEKVAFEALKTLFYREKYSFDSLKLASESLLTRAKSIKEMLEDVNNRLAILAKDSIALEKRAGEIEKRKNELNRIVPAHLNLTLFGDGRTSISGNSYLGAYGVGASLQYRYSVQGEYSDRIGVMYTVSKNLDWQTFTPYAVAEHALFAVMDYSERVRVGIGVGAPMKPFVPNTEIRYNATLSVTLNRTEIPCAIAYFIKSDSQFSNLRHELGLSIGWSLNFLRF